MNISEKNEISSKELYEKLGLSESNYSHWCKRNIVDNLALTEGTDYKCVVSSTRLDNELENTGLKPNFGQEYLLTLEAAASLAMETHTKEGRKLRDDLFKATLVSQSQFKELMVQFQKFQETISQINDNTIALGNRVMALESDKSIPDGKVSEWFSEAYESIEKLVANGSWGYSFKEVLSEIILKMGIQEHIDMSVYTKYYMEEHGLTKVPNKLYVIDDNSDLRYVFDEIVDYMMACIEDHSEAADEVALQAAIEEEMFKAPEGYDYPSEIAGIPGRGVPTPKEQREFEARQKLWLEKERERENAKKEIYWDDDDIMHYYDPEKEQALIEARKEYIRKQEEERKRVEELRKKYPNNPFLNGGHLPS